MKILIFNWRDVKNPKSGGAEILTHEMAKRWVNWGNEVTLFSSRFHNSAKEEVLDGVRILRSGHPDARSLFSSVHFQAFLAYKKEFEGRVDVVLDETHGLPFFTPWYVKEKKVALICEVAMELWVELFGLFFGSIGRFVEKFYLGSVYKNIPILTISKSTEEELIKEGVSRNNITILPMGVNIPLRIKEYPKETDLTLIFIGRLSKAKGIEDAILTLKEVSRALPNPKLWVIGRGEESYVHRLKKLARKLKIDEKITWYGFIDENKKFELLARANILISPSIKEGWGLTITEAALVGTPSVVYNSAGLRDVLGKSNYKIIVKSNTPEEISFEVIKLFNDPVFLRKLELNRPKKESFDWEKTAKKALELMR